MGKKESSLSLNFFLFLPKSLLMQITPFRDYSQSLIPLPSLNEENGCDGAFMRELRNRLGVDVSANRTPQTPEPLGPSQIFDLTGPTSRTPSPASSTSDYCRYLSRPVYGRTVEASTADESDELMKLCRDVEGLLLGIFLRHLGKDLGASSLFSQKWETSMYQDMFFYELAQSIGKTPPGLGIAEMVYNDIISKSGSVADLFA